MATLTETTEKVSELFGEMLPIETATSHARYLRADRLVSIKGRGTSAAQMTSSDAATLFLSVLLSHSPKDAAKSVDTAKKMTFDRVVNKYDENSNGIPSEFYYEEFRLLIFDLNKDHSLFDFIERCLSKSALQRDYFVYENFELLVDLSGSARIELCREDERLDKKYYVFLEYSIKDRLLEEDAFSRFDDKTPLQKEENANEKILVKRSSVGNNVSVFKKVSINLMVGLCEFVNKT